jgi:hypothetical protein
VLSAADQDLCAAVQRQEVEVITLETVEEYAVWQKPPDFARGLPGFETPSFLEGSSIESVVMSARGVVDIANEGRPRSIAMVKSVGSACAGCGCWDFSWQWPVVTTKEGVPELDSPLSRAAHSAGNRITNLIRHRSRVYLDSRGWPGDGSIHAVTAISIDGTKKMCELEPLQYVMRPPKPVDGLR